MDLHTYLQTPLVRFVSLALTLAIAACARDGAPQPTNEPEAAAADGGVDGAAVAAPADSGLSIKRGVVAFPDDRATFRPCGEAADLLLLDQTDGVLARAFPGAETASLYIEAYGERAPGDARGTEAGDHVGTFVLEEVLYAAAQDQVKGCNAPAPDYIVLARGNEPFWAAEVREGEIIWRQPDEPREIVFESPEQQHSEGAVRYRASAAGRDIEVLIDARACRDSMSGEFFAYSARAVLGEREFTGCARVGQ